MSWSLKHIFQPHQQEKGYSGDKSEVPSSCTVSGKMAAANLVISGNFEGELISSDLLTTTSESIFNGIAVVNDAVLGGRFYGEIRVKGQVTLLSTAILEGNIVCSNLKIDLGARFDGRCYTPGTGFGLVKYS